MPAIVLFGQSTGGAYRAANSGASYLASTYHVGIDVSGTWKTIKTATGVYPLDAIGQHIYVDQRGYTTPATIAAYQDWLRAAYVHYEGASTSKATIVTEAGWTTGGGAGVAAVAPDQQARNADALIWAARAVPYLSVLTWFQLQDNPASGYYYGLYTSTWSARPSPSHLQTQ